MVFRIFLKKALQKTKISLLVFCILQFCSASQASSDQVLCQAAANSDLAGVQSALTNGANADVICSNNYTATQLALSHVTGPGSIGLQIAKLLQKNGAKGSTISTRYYDGKVIRQSNLSVAAFFLDIDLISAYLESEAIDPAKLVDNPLGAMTSYSVPKNFLNSDADYQKREALYLMLVDYGFNEFPALGHITGLPDETETVKNAYFLHFNDEFILSRISALSNNNMPQLNYLAYQLVANSLKTYTLEALKELVNKGVNLRLPNGQPYLVQGIVNLYDPQGEMKQGREYIKYLVELARRINYDVSGNKVKLLDSARSDAPWAIDELNLDL